MHGCARLCLIVLEAMLEAMLEAILEAMLEAMLAINDALIS